MMIVTTMVADTHEAIMKLDYEGNYCAQQRITLSLLLWVLPGWQ